MSTPSHVRVLVRYFLLTLVFFCVVAIGVVFGVQWADNSPVLPGYDSVELRPCSAAFATGELVTDAFVDNGCKGPDGAARKPVVHACKDGRRYVQMGDLIGFVGEKPYNVRNQPLLEPMYKVQCLR